MTNKKKQQQRLYWFVLAFLTYACGMMLWVGGLDEAVPQTTPVYAQSTKQVTNNAVGAKSDVVRNSDGLSDKQQAVKEQIIAIAKDEGYEAPLWLARLAFCESSLNPQAKNAHSSALGLFQILDKHGLTSEQRTSVDYSTRWTIKQLKAGHASWWSCSEIIS